MEPHYRDLLVRLTLTSLSNRHLLSDGKGDLDNPTMSNPRSIFRILGINFHPLERRIRRPLTLSSGASREIRSEV